MDYRTFGRTGAEVSALGFGGGPAGVPNYRVLWDSQVAATLAQVERAREFSPR
jgi:aryl-alcohol dehydrogenase-like predicted oxidoreductase